MSLCERSKLSILVPVLISLLVSVRAQDQNPYICTSDGNYTSNSTYSANLNALLTSLSLNMSDNGFCNSSVGQNQDRVSAFALCRADQTLDQCRNCVRAAARAILQVCPNQKEAVLWYELCTLLYSNDSIHRTSDGRWTGLVNTRNVSIENVYFREDLNRLLLDLRVQAANGSSELKVGVGNRSTADSESPTIYALLQCTPDLSLEVCRKCLDDTGGNVLRRYDLTRGMRMLSPNCNIRYEMYTFYNETRLRERRVLPPLPPSPPPSLPPSPIGRNDNNSRAKKDDNTTKLVVTILVSVAVCLLLVACAVVFLRKRIKLRSPEITESELRNDDEISTVESLQYDFAKIRAATNDFDHANKLGQGGFGAVYRGKLQNDQEIAVKRLSKNSGQGNTEFKNEVLLVARLQHRNLVRLLGFSLEGTERLLVYEFVQNASLDKFIFDPIKRSHLDWDTRYKIIGGVGRGLLYLHEDSRLRIIHRDLKASNVLLDEDMNPKIADFGMARLFRQGETQGNTNNIVGTYGYMSPEYAMHGRFSIKSDVFSFGVLILEIISGQRNNCIQRGENVADLLTLTWENWQEGTAADMIDPLLRNSRGSLSEMLRCIHIGLLCVQENPANRPTMASIVLMLNSSTMTLPVPLAPAFYMGSRFGPQVSISHGYDSKTSKSEGSSQNDMSVTVLYPR